jgi:hypothetical protein
MSPKRRLLLRDKQDEKRIASPANVPETSSVTSASVLPLPQLILRPAPAPLLNPRSMLTDDVGPCGVVGDALASSKRSGKSTGLLLAGYAAAYALRHTRHAYLAVSWPESFSRCASMRSEHLADPLLLFYNLVQCRYSVRLTQCKADQN